MASWFRVTARTVAYRFPLVLGTLRIVAGKVQKIREFKNVYSLLVELHSDTAIQLPLLVEQNRKMFREIQSLKLQVQQLQQQVDAVTKS